MHNARLFIQRVPLGQGRRGGRSARLWRRRWQQDLLAQWPVQTAHRPTRRQLVQEAGHVLLQLLSGQAGEVREHLLKVEGAGVEGLRVPGGRRPRRARFAAAAEAAQEAADSSATSRT